jgi:hypothetical protein
MAKVRAVPSSGPTVTVTTSLPWSIEVRSAIIEIKECTVQLAVKQLDSISVHKAQALQKAAVRTVMLSSASGIILASQQETRLALGRKLVIILENFSPESGEHQT